MRWKKTFGIFLITVIGSVLFGCGKEDADPIISSEMPTELDTQTEAVVSEEDTIVWYIDQYNVNPQISRESITSDTALNCKIYDEFNKKLKEKGFDKTVQFRTIIKEPEDSSSMFSYHYEKLKEKKDNGEKVDIFTYVGGSDELAYDFSKELNETKSGKLLYEQIPEKIWKQLEKDNKQYYVYNNNIQTLARCAGYEWNKELAEKYHLTEEDLKKDPEEWIDVLEMEKQAGSNGLYPIYEWYNQLYIYGKYDYLGGAELELLFVVSADPQNPSVQNIYENEDYIQQFRFLHMLQEKEYANNSQKSSEEFVKNILYSMPEQEEKLAEQNNTIRVAREQPYFSVNLPYKTQCIASWSEQKEKALELLALVMSDPELSNLLEYGIEGVNYEVKNGEVSALDSVGKTMLMKAGSIDSLGNTAITLPKEMEVENKKECYERYVDSVETYPAVGFIPDYSNVKKEYEACKEIISNQYSMKDSLFNGTVKDVDEELNRINTQLKEAGVELVLTELNRQLQEYVQTKNK